MNNDATITPWQLWTETHDADEEPREPIARAHIRAPDGARRAPVTSPATGLADIAAALDIEGGTAIEIDFRPAGRGSLGTARAVLPRAHIAARASSTVDGAAVAPPAPVYDLIRQMLTHAVETQTRAAQAIQDLGAAHIAAQERSLAALSEITRRSARESEEERRAHLDELERLHSEALDARAEAQERDEELAAQILAERQAVEDERRQLREEIAARDAQLKAASEESRPSLAEQALEGLLLRLMPD